MTLEIILLLLWYISGVASFIYWWTSEYDLTGKELVLGLCVGAAGPLVWPMGRIIHGKPSKKQPIIFKKKRK